MRQISWVALASLAACSHAILVTSDPSGAEVVYNGALRGTTPTKVPDEASSSGAYALTVSKHGYKEKTISVDRPMSPGIVTCSLVSATAFSVVGLLFFWPACLGAPVAAASIWSHQGPDSLHVKLEPEFQAPPPPAQMPLLPPPPPPPAVAP